MQQTVVLGLPLAAWFFVLLAVGAVVLAGYAVVTEQRRRMVVRRAAGGRDITAAVPDTTSEPAGDGVFQRIAERMAAMDADSGELANKLVRAGFDTPSAPATFAVARIASSVALPMLALILVSKDNLLQYIVVLGIAAAVGIMAPTALLDRLTQQRQDTIRKGIPDTLDLLVVCLEAGVALDAAIQRVARELNLVHRILSEELVGMSRRIAAGVPREQAMQSLFTRTGVDELRSLASHMIQSEKWGTSIVTVLRVYGDQLRRKRRMEAEKRAATASTRMLFPLMIFIFPTIFVVLLGPAMMRIMDMFGSMG